MSEDEERLHRIEFEQISLKTAHQGLDDRTTRLEDITQELKEVIYGDRRKKIDGIIPIQDEHAELLRKVNAVFFQDNTGQKGYLHDVDILMGRRKDDYSTTAIRWKFWGSIIVAIIMGLSTIFNWDHIQAWLTRKDTDPIDHAIERAKHKKGKPIVGYRKVPSDEEMAEPPVSIAHKEILYKELLRFLEKTRPNHSVFLADPDTRWPEFERLPFRWDGRDVYVYRRSA